MSSGCDFSEHEKAAQIVGEESLSITIDKAKVEPEALPECKNHLYLG